jgi:hypothetical protein
MLKTTEDARTLFATHLKYSDLTRVRVHMLRKMINNEMVASGLLYNSFRCKQRVEFHDGRGWAGIKCRSYSFEDREAVSFNPGGFIGFAGWSDSTNIRPILDGFEKWVDWMIGEKS